MGIQIIGNSATILEVESNTRAARTTLRPIDYATYGQYSIATITATMAAGLAANSEIYQFRWTDATRLALIKNIRISAVTLGTGFTAGIGKFDVLLARGFSAAGSGGAVATITGNNGKLRTSMGTTLLGEIRTATTAALGVGTKTLDTQGIINVAFGVSASTNVTLLGLTDLFRADADSRHPLVLAQNEGFVIRATVPATGTWDAYISTEWVELASY